MATIATNNSMVKTDFSDVYRTHTHTLKHIWPASVPQLDARSTDDQEVAVWPPAGGHSFIEIDHEIFSTVILSILPIQEGQFQFLAKECTILVNCLEDHACSKRVVK